MADPSIVEQVAALLGDGVEFAARIAREVGNG